LFGAAAAAGRAAEGIRLVGGHGEHPSLTATIRRRTRGGTKLVTLLLAIADDTQATPRDRIAAAKVLLEYGFSWPTPADDAPDVTELLALLNGPRRDGPPREYDE
jgi:hypothetical protein